MKIAGALSMGVGADRVNDRLHESRCERLSVRQA